MNKTTAVHLCRSAALLSSLWLGGCLSGSGDFIEVPADEARFSLSGTLSIAAGISVDSDVNDAFAAYTSNDDPAAPQALFNNALLHGFASATGTGGSAAEQRFYNSADQDDYFSVSLQQGQTIRLQVTDVGDGDLDLFLYAPYDASWDVSASLRASQGRGERGEFEEITVPADGDYLLNVYAHSGFSKYVLQILPATSGSSAPAATADFVPGELVVQYQASASLASRSASTAAAQRPQLVSLNQGSRAASSISHPLQQFSPVLYEKRRTLIEAKRLSQQDDVVWAEPNYIVRALTTPNDTRYPQQWHYPAINLPQAWDLTTGNATPEVIVAVIDTGVYLAHPDLALQLVPGFDFIRDSANARDGNGIDNDPDDPGDSDSPGASSWHGTHVAGTIAAASNNGSGVAGVSWAAKIMPLRVLGKDGGTTYDVAQAIYFAAGQTNDSGSTPERKADIINLSLGADTATNSERNAINAALAAGVLVVAAAGNDNTSAPSYPAAYNGVIAVAATNPAGNKAYYSNTGSHISLAAPGGEMTSAWSDGILSTVADDSTGTRRPSYAFMQGTSMAAPHVAGVLALMKAEYPALTHQQVQSLISTCAITNRSDACSHDTQLGYGQIDAYKAVLQARELATGTAPAVPAIVQADKSQLTFGSSLSQTLTLSNVGDNGVINLTMTPSTSWLSISEQTVDNEKMGQYTVSADPAGLSAGLYSATLTIGYADATAPATEKSLRIAVSMLVGTVTTAGEMAQPYVLLEDADCTLSNCVISTVFADPSGRYQFRNIPAGNYRIYAGSDIDVDGLICDTGETCGTYPSLGTPQIIRVSSDRSGLNLLLTLTSGLNSSGLSIHNLQSDPASTKAR